MMKTYKILLSFFLILMSGMGFSQSVPSYVPTNGLVGWWGFNGNAQDGSGNGNHGIVNGATSTADRFGNQNGAYSFNGLSDYIEVSDNNSLDLTNNYTFSVWVKIVDYSLNNANEPMRTMLSKPRNSGGSGYSFRAIEGVDWNSDGNALPYLSGWNNHSVNGGLESLQDSLSLNVWTNLVFSYNGSIAKLYKNSQLVNSAATIFSLINSTESFFVGKEFQALNPINNRWFKGKLDDIGIWNRALTQQEITNLYNSQLPAQTSLCLPTITTSSPTSVGVDTVVIGGDISNDGGSSIVLRGICYSTSPNPNMGNQRTEDGSGTGSFNAVLRGLASSTTYYARSYAKNFNGVVVYGNEVIFTTSASLPGVRCPGAPTVTDIDGNIYNTVQIGTQCWTQSNLKVSKYRNGDSITTGLNNSAWQNTMSGAYAIYNNEQVNEGLYGKLYNHYAVTDSRGLCPTGWHVPSDGEFNQMILHLDQNADTSCIICIQCGNCNQSSIAGGLIKSTITAPLPGGWYFPNSGALNYSGFSGLGGGNRYQEGYYNGLGVDGYWWTSTIVGAGYGWFRSLYYNDSMLRRDGFFLNTGFSVRCLKD
jgi:uncharacterized protein (TIGR02145 family)